MRAEPISLLYEKGRFLHRHGLDRLEGEMMAFSREGDRAVDGSPNRLDAIPSMLPANTLAAISNVVALNLEPQTTMAVLGALLAPLLQSAGRDPAQVRAHAKASAAEAKETQAPPGEGCRQVHRWPARERRRGGAES